jgi:hypothetical protein
VIRWETLRPPTFLKLGENLTFDSRWGDFEATSYTGFGSNHVWVASQYAGLNGDWATGSLKKSKPCREGHLFLIIKGTFPTLPYRAVTQQCLFA